MRPATGATHTGSTASEHLPRGTNANTRAITEAIARRKEAGKPRSSRRPRRPLHGPGKPRRPLQDAGAGQDSRASKIRSGAFVKDQSLKPPELCRDFEQFLRRDLPDHFVVLVNQLTYDAAGRLIDAHASTRTAPLLLDGNGLRFSLTLHAIVQALRLLYLPRTGMFPCGGTQSRNRRRTCTGGKQARGGLFRMLLHSHMHAPANAFAAMPDETGLFHMASAAAVWTAPDGARPQNIIRPASSRAAGRSAAQYWLGQAPMCLR